jgi:isopentenyl-diphosphate delta-isomerase
LAEQTENRKTEHIRIALKENVEFREKTTGFEDIAFKDIELDYKTMPELDQKEIDTTTEFFGKKFNAPIMVAAITGGVLEAEKINKDIASACEELGVGMGLGSQRAMLENPATTQSYFVRDVAPNIFLAGNIGIVQAKKYSSKQLDKALNDIKADILAVHSNAAQEALQPEGTVDFSGAFETIKRLRKELKHPFFVKEVGSGVSKEIAAKLQKLKVKAIDVGGSGGTSWTGIDSLRGNKEIGETYWDFGIPTAVSIIETKKVFKGKIIATGGIRTGLDVAKSIVLGADLCGIALPVLRAQAFGGKEAVKEYLEKVIKELKIAMFLTGAKNICELKKKKYFVIGKTKDWLSQKKR